jgi:hypothetical protein
MALAGMSVLFSPFWCNDPLINKIIRSLKMVETGGFGKNTVGTVAMICIAAAMIVIIIKHGLLAFLAGSPLWATIEANSSVIRYFFLGVKTVTMISVFALVMTDIRSKITDAGLWLIFIGVALLV